MRFRLLTLLQLLVALIPTLGMVLVSTKSQNIMASPLCPSTAAYCWSSLSSRFHGQPVVLSYSYDNHVAEFSKSSPSSTWLAMRKQKASDRRTSRRQRGEETMISPAEAAMTKAAKEVFSSPVTITTSPMQLRPWIHKKTSLATVTAINPTAPIDRSGTRLDSNDEPGVATSSGGGRQRSRKRTALYNSLSLYHTIFLQHLTTEYQVEEEEVLGRIRSSIENPIRLETAGHVVFDMTLERRGNLFSDQVYRLTKAKDATTKYPGNDPRDQATATTSKLSRAGEMGSAIRYLPPNHKFATNDVILLTLQPNGSGDYFSVQSIPTSETAISLEARVLNTGPTYIDITVSSGLIESTFGIFETDLTSELRYSRFRVDRFFSNIPYQRMVEALSALTSIPDRSMPTPTPTKQVQANPSTSIVFGLDEIFRVAILSTFVDLTNTDGSRELDMTALKELSNMISKPPLPTSSKIANQVMIDMKSNSRQIYPFFNKPQLFAIEAAQTRRLTLIQGPPGTGKTTCASAIGFGFVQQCRSFSSSTKVLACAFSNVGADNLAEAMRKLGLSIVRIGRPSAVTETLWNCTLDAAIDRDPAAQAALKEAGRATLALARLSKLSGAAKSSSNERAIRDAATRAVKASIEACNVAATRALRSADVIVSTSTGASDPRLLAACGLTTIESSTVDSKSRSRSASDSDTKRSSNGGLLQSLKENAPDGLPPLSLPFVIIDEACQSIEPATLIPIVASNSCRSLVMLGDPCQLPPTVRSQEASQLSISLFERLAACLPPPAVHAEVDPSGSDVSYLDSAPIKKALLLLQSSPQIQSNRTVFPGAILLSIQYRMHPSIAAFSSAVFYNGRLSTPKVLAGQRMFPSVLRTIMPCIDENVAVRLVNVGGRCNERRGTPTRTSPAVFKYSVAEASEEGTTYWNEAEAERVITLLHSVVSAKEPGIRSIGIISPYSGQVELIKNLIAGDIILPEQEEKTHIDIEVKSVDGYQGRERDLIIFSAVRSNRRGRIGFVNDWRRMNVALTRARCGLVVIGDLGTLSEADENWAALVKWASEGRYIAQDDVQTT